jgi:hypothetical protein
MTGVEGARSEESGDGSQERAGRNLGTVPRSWFDCVSLRSPRTGGGVLLCPAICLKAVCGHCPGAMCSPRPAASLERLAMSFRARLRSSWGTAEPGRLPTLLLAPDSYPGMRTAAPRSSPRRRRSRA